MALDFSLYTMKVMLLKQLKILSWNYYIRCIGIKAYCSQGKSEKVIVIRVWHDKGLAIVIFIGKFKKKDESESKWLTNLKD